MKKLIFFFAAAALFAAEPSVFEAGDLNSQNPYGLTPTEKAIYKNKKDIQLLQQQLYSLQSSVNSLQERVAGIESLVEGIDENLNKIRKSGSVEQQNSSAFLEELQSELNATIDYQKKEFAKLKSILRKLTKMVDHIDATYVSKSELNKELAKIYKIIGKGAPHSASSSKSSKKTSLKLSGKEAYVKARQAYKKHQYKKAKELFELAAAAKYKPATSNFYTGESCYYTKDYACAVQKYKKSASLYANSSYMPTLLLHTAISLEKLGKKDEAQKFYKNLVRLYPKSKAATLAKKYMK
ncbi:tol-pal system YbgF family protein [Nitratiruptor sp. YY09-18]|uniref:tetratricopeptide repeat protein n=1 Tax=Nitratiruptor sp. YY09-18 TaxID=2724901 RepID=UPI00191645D9|nr:tetratricopeptide repeat protein [Nitratiruptor sp. YY09-18]BCD67789.1 hypothetical protein NitYY0918_C0696 [Nitratiruptor sp. YY09-18]